MQLTGKQIVERGIVTGVVTEGIQQQGVDVRLDKVIEFDQFDAPETTQGYVPAVGKTILRQRHEIPTGPTPNGEGWVLKPGYYEVIVKEGCVMPNNAAMRFISRSSLVRNGAIIHCGQFDAGFKTDQMGFFLQVLFPITIDRGARIAQAMVFESAPVDEGSLYNGQWQGDKQRQKSAAEIEKELEDEAREITHNLQQIFHPEFQSAYHYVVHIIEIGQKLQAVKIINGYVGCGLKMSNFVADEIANKRM
jgi:deoxycytidine triphosphate deaminase